MSVSITIDFPAGTICDCCGDCLDPDLLYYGASDSETKPGLCGAVNPQDGKVYATLTQNCATLPPGGVLEDTGAPYYCKCTETNAWKDNKPMVTTYSRDSNGNCNSSSTGGACTYISTTEGTWFLEGQVWECISCAGSSSQPYPSAGLSSTVQYSNVQTPESDSALLSKAETTANSKKPGSNFPNQYSYAEIAWGAANQDGSHSSVYVSVCDYAFQFKAPSSGYAKITWNLVTYIYNAKNQQTSSSSSPQSYVWTGEGNGDTVTSPRMTIPMPSVTDGWGYTDIEDVDIDCTAPQ